MATVSAKYGYGIYGSSEYGQLNVSASVSGVQASGSIGTVEAQPKEVVISVEATGSVGSVVVNLTTLLSGVSATFAVNSAGINLISVNRIPLSTGTEGTLTLGTPTVTGVDKVFPPLGYSKTRTYRLVPNEIERVA